VKYFVVQVNKCSLKDLKSIKSIDFVSLDGIVRLMESIDGYEKFSDKVIAKIIFDLKTRRQMRQVGQIYFGI
jgi:hypothetical protein